ncbi:MAG: hypothetical protein JWM10_3714 [Myxococcaceae bacterium]|nr:hypothetical protein [Myxococcaceae bacterium]
MTVAGATSLSDELVEMLVEMHGEAGPDGKRRTWRQLAEFASMQSGRTVTHMVVHRAVKPIIDERAEMLREALRTKIGEKLNGQVDTLDDLMTKVANDATNAKGPMARRKSLDVFRKALDSKLRVSGVTSEGKVTVSGDAAGLAQFLATAFNTGTGTPAT